MLERLDRMTGRFPSPSAPTHGSTKCRINCLYPLIVLLTMYIVRSRWYVGTTGQDDRTLPKSFHPCLFHPCKICLEGFFTLHLLLGGCHVDYLPKFDACSVSVRCSLSRLNTKIYKTVGIPEAVGITRRN
jgi:hypothetical protein